MKQFQPNGAKVPTESPETKEKITAKKQELQNLKRALKAAPQSKKAEIKSQIKALVKELKIIAPQSASW